MNIKKYGILFLMTFLAFLPAKADECDTICPDFEGFFRNNYAELAKKLSPCEEKCRIFNILFSAYSIKFKTIDYEYSSGKEALLDENNRECEGEIRKYLRNLKEIAIEEYDSFLDDLSFELCDEEGFEHRTIKKNKKKYKKELKKMIAKCE